MRMQFKLQMCKFLKEFLKEFTLRVMFEIMSKLYET